MIDNFELIGRLLRFEQPTDFYYIEVTKRKKENPDFKKSSKVVSRYLISDLCMLEYYKDDIIKDCKVHNARAYIRLNRRNIDTICLQTSRMCMEYFMNKQPGGAKDAFWKACGSYHDESKSTKSWIVDIDNKDEHYIRGTELIINNTCDPRGDKIISRIPTKNGVHLITHPFNTNQFDKVFPNNGIDIHKDNPTILYIA